MNHRFLAVGAFVLLLCTSTAVRADPYSDGLVALLNGDYASALRLLRPLAEEGNLGAASMVGGMYLGGFGVEKDCGKAESLIGHAADGGYPRAQYLMGRIYVSGMCGMVNPRESFSWFKKAAKQHDPDAAFTVGLLFAEGKAVPMDLAEAYCWFKASLIYFDEAYDKLPVEPGAPLLRNKVAAEKNVGVLKGMLAEADRRRAERLSCTTE